jgi:hypothetical protein
MGMANAMVFPVPVRLPAIQSRPSNISGIHAFWMAVGLRISIAVSEEISHAETWRDSKVVEVMGIVGRVDF